MSDSTTSALGELLADDRPTMAVSFTDRISDDELAGVASSGLDVAELRIDRFESSDPDDVVTTVKRFSQFPTIATVRTRREGGSWTGDDATRLRLFEAVIDQVDGIDVELASTEILSPLVARARASNTVVIISSHDFNGTPLRPQLDDITTRAKSLGADYVKIAAMTRSRDELRRLAAFTIERAELGLIVIAMGPIGTVSRVCFPALGSALTYAHMGEDAVPGQMDYRQTNAMLAALYPDSSRPASPSA